MAVSVDLDFIFSRLIILVHVSLVAVVIVVVVCLVDIVHVTRTWRNNVRVGVLFPVYPDETNPNQAEIYPGFHEKNIARQWEKRIVVIHSFVLR